MKRTLTDPCLPCFLHELEVLLYFPIRPIRRPLIVTFTVSVNYQFLITFQAEKWLTGSTCRSKSIFCGSFSGEKRNWKHLPVSFNSLVDVDLCTLLSCSLFRLCGCLVAKQLLRSKWLLILWGEFIEVTVFIKL